MRLTLMSKTVSKELECLQFVLAGKADVHMVEKNKLLGEKLATAKNRGKEHFVAELRFASLTINSNILNRLIELNDISN